MMLGLNYPRGPFGWARRDRPDHVLAVLDALRDELGEERYRAAPMLRAAGDSRSDVHGCTASLTNPRAAGTVCSSVTQAPVPALPGRPPRGRLAVPGRRRRPRRRRRLLPGDVHRGDARLSAHCARDEPARVGADDRAPQGARPPPRPGAPARPGRRSPRRAGAARAPSRAATASGTRVRDLPPKQRAALLLRFAGDLPHREVAARARLLRGGRPPLGPRGAQEAARGARRMTDDLDPTHLRPGRRGGRRRALRGHRAPPTSPTPLIDSPVGTLVAADDGPRPRVPVATTTTRAASTPCSTRIAARISPRVLEPPARLDAVRRELDEYFERRRTDFDLPIDWSLVSPSAAGCSPRRARSRSARSRPTRTSPPRPATPKASRAAGNALGSNPMPIVVPCHRVLHTGGKGIGELHRRRAPQGGAAAARGRAARVSAPSCADPYSPGRGNCDAACGPTCRPSSARAGRRAGAPTASRGSGSSATSCVIARSIVRATVSGPPPSRASGPRS